jgi:threonine aldolase
VYVRKQVNQLPSKMRFIAAQFLALLEGDRWIELAAHANAMATLLWERTSDLEVLGLTTPPAVNSLFPVLPADVGRQLQEWCFFWDWDVSAGQYRWMTAWDTTEQDIERFAAGVRHFLALCN